MGRLTAIRDDVETLLSLLRAYDVGCAYKKTEKQQAYILREKMAQLSANLWEVKNSKC